MNADERFEMSKACHKLGELQEWDKWIKEVPFISWPSNWKVKAVPPFGSAVVRYLVRVSEDEEVSVYLDCYDQLGCVGKPYWEVYPYKGDTGRCLINEVDELIKMIGDRNE